MAAAKLARRARDVLSANRDNAVQIAQGAGLKRTQKLLRDAQNDLNDRLMAVGGSDDDFTRAQMRATLAQIQQVTRDLAGGMKDVVVDAGVQAAEAAAAHTVGYLSAADEAFKGVGTQPLALREASMFEAATDGARTSILMRLAADEDHPARMGVLQRYGVSTIDHFEKTLQRGLLTRKSWSEMQEDLTDGSPFLQQAPAFWATRIVRTEVMGAYNRAGYESTKEADEQLGDMTKILSAVFDDRTGADSYATHGQIRRPEEPFETWYGEMQHPPDRPNDRGIVVPHRISWVIPKYLEWRTAEQIAMRWLYEGRKGKPPERPEMTTVDLSLFGKPAPKQLDDPESG